MYNYYRILLIKNVVHAIYCITGKFEGELNLAVWRIDQPTTKISSLHIYIHVYMMILYRAAKLKSANISESYVWDETAKFSSLDGIGNLA